ARLFDNFVGILAFVAPMLAVTRLVSGDRAPGLTRFLFAKPVSVRRFYAQVWVVRAVAATVIAALAGAAINAFISEVPWKAGVGAFAISFLLIGGVGFLLSVVSRIDSGLLIAAYLLPDVLSQIIQAKPTWSWWATPALTVMPPMHRLDEIRSAL